MKDWPSTIGKYVLENSRVNVISLCDTKGGTMFTQWLTFSVWRGVLSAVFHCFAGQASSPPTDQLTKVDLRRFIRLRPWWTAGLVWTKGKRYLLTDLNWRRTQSCHLKVDSCILQLEWFAEKVLFLLYHCPYVTKPSDSACICFQCSPYCGRTVFSPSP